MLWRIPKTNLITAPIVRTTRLRLEAMIMAGAIVGGFLLAAVLAGFQGVGAYHRVMAEYQPVFYLNEPPPTRQALVVSGVYFVGAGLCAVAAFLLLFVQLRMNANHRLLLERGRFTEGIVTNVESGVGYAYVSGQFAWVSSRGYIVEFEHAQKTFKTAPVRIPPGTKVNVAFDPENPTLCVVVEAAAVKVVPPAA